MACLIDTNVLVYLANPQAPEHALAKAAIQRWFVSDDRPVLAAQSLFEFWSVATLPIAANGLGWSSAETRSGIDIIRSRFLILEEPASVVDFWLDIVVTHQIEGKRIHDIHLLATMKANTVDHLLTFNPADFPAVPGISVLSPVR